MSITSRSQSSSPDILGPPGDAEYLISSPIKPFTGRQSWMSPAVSKRQLTPAKRPRATLSPGKSGAHSIRFDDILLPGSPSRKLTGRQRSLSPEKIQQDGNVSPWRIRVTLEATQDEENQVEASPSRKRRRPSTVTTMVPLKDERSPLMERTPARKRGRPRKSDALPQNGSPWPGSPGHTPGPNEVSTEKRKRGRPRKGTPKPARVETHIADDAPISEPLGHVSPMDMTAEVADPADAGRQWSPINLGGEEGFDSDSLGADDLPVANLRAPTPARPETWNNDTGREYGRTTYDTPIIADTEQQFEDDDRNIHSTPSKMPSPTRERLGSSRSSRRGTTSSPHTYPSPSPTSSPGEEENRARENRLHEIETIHQQPTSDAMEDPTDDHEEFDSIMESEGFTMVSLDTLPSAKQFGLGSGARNATDNASKILRDREKGVIGERLKRKLGGGIDGLRSDHNSARPSPLARKHSPAYQGSQDPQLEPIHPRQRSSPHVVSYPELPVTISPEKPRSQQETFDDMEQDEFEGDVEYEHETDQPNQDERDLEEVDEEEDEPAMIESPPFTRQSPPQHGSANPSRNREYRWQKEREIVSRHAADPMNAARLVYIDSDESASNNEDAGGKGLEDLPLSDAQSAIGQPFEEELEEEQPFDQEPVNEHVDEESADEHLYENINQPLYQTRYQHRYEPLEPVYEESVNEEFVDENIPKEPHYETFDQYPRQPSHQRPYRTRHESLDEEPLDEPQYETSKSSFRQPLHQNPHKAHYKSLDEEPVDEAPEYLEPEIKPGTFTSYQEADSGKDVLEEDNESVDIWQQEVEPDVGGEPEVRSNQPSSDERDIDPEMPDEDGFDDIWQQEARDHSHISQNSDDFVSPLQESKSPWKRIARSSVHQDNLSSSPAYVTLEHDEARHFDRTHIRKLRDQEIDLSAIMAEDDTPNRARYYNGTSTPRSILRRPGPQSSAMKSDSRKPEKRVRLQPISQSPERHSEAEIDSPGPHRISHVQSPQELHPNRGVPGSEIQENESVQELTATPEPSHQAEGQPEATWFQRITSLTPRWLKAPPKSRYDDTSSEVSEEEQDYEQSDQEGNEHSQSAPDIREKPEHEPRSSPSHQSSVQQLDEPAGSPSVDYDDHRASIEADDPWIQPEVTDDAMEDDAVADQDKLQRLKPGPRPLAVFGYFSDAHYTSLRRIYRMAKRHPERFPYFDAPGRAEIMGDWMWLSDGRHGVPITEVQFAVIDRFVHELSNADIEYGGSGQVDWTEADLHRRLISIIIGEQIREERKARTTRGASVDTWR
ncbi:hypothetical protein N7520_007643 [Penicillium odoratum]|uniref:uncharacterized protein n=1 Tax=Penicillium odoratum TaxID=1167516 RepID=UPI002547A52F|nr:uncharacterized protein N7520_007643 [Penicillium odoratum]KAJ5760487.1 hypothetical protein N7520_007643 [Penicillium odoratum]